MLFLVTVLAASALPLPPAQQQLTTCYISNVHRLYTSNEPASVVTETVMALCSHLEDAARLEIKEETAQTLVREGTASYKEAREIVNSIERKSRADWHYRYRGLIQSQVMDFRQRKSL